MIKTDFSPRKKRKDLFQKVPQSKTCLYDRASRYGLGYDNVIVVNAEHSVYGFPSQIEDDPIMKFVTLMTNHMNFPKNDGYFTLL